MVNLHYAYHLGGVGYTTEDCINLKHKIQDFIDQKVVTLQTIMPNVNTDSLSNHGDFTINMVGVKEN